MWPLIFSLRNTACIDTVMLFSQILVFVATITLTAHARLNASLSGLDSSDSKLPAFNSGGLPANDLRARATSPAWLRILPLGASIVRGLKSTPEDGFRKPLRDRLRSEGYLVNMIGSQ